MSSLDLRAVLVAALAVANASSSSGAGAAAAGAAGMFASVPDPGLQQQQLAQEQLSAAVDRAMKVLGDWQAQVHDRLARMLAAEDSAVVFAAASSSSMGGSPPILSSLPLFPSSSGSGGDGSLDMQTPAEAALASAGAARDSGDVAGSSAPLLQRFGSQGQTGGASAASTTTAVRAVDSGVSSTGHFGGAPAAAVSPALAAALRLFTTQNAGALKGKPVMSPSAPPCPYVSPRDSLTVTPIFLLPQVFLLSPRPSRACLSGAPTNSSWTWWAEWSLFARAQPNTSPSRMLSIAPTDTRPHSPC